MPIARPPDVRSLRYVAQRIKYGSFLIIRRIIGKARHNLKCADPRLVRQMLRHFCRMGHLLYVGMITETTYRSLSALGRPTWTSGTIFILPRYTL